MGNKVTVLNKIPTTTFSVDVEFDVPCKMSALEVVSQALTESMSSVEIEEGSYVFKMTAVLVKV